MSNIRDSGRLVVLASGGGSNFQALLDHFGTDHAPGPANELRVAGLIVSSAGAGAIGRAERAGTDHEVLPPADDPEHGPRLEAALLRWNPDLVVLAGYLLKVPAATVREFRGRMINIHPALLPAFGGRGMYGTHVHRAVIEAGVTLSGVTVHFVTEEYDRGPAVVQWPVPVMAGDSPEDLAARVLRVEHQLLPLAAAAVASGSVALVSGGSVRRQGKFSVTGGFPLRSPWTVDAN